jgi:hypothetical protein
VFAPWKAVRTVILLLVTELLALVANRLTSQLVNSASFS